MDRREFLIGGGVTTALAAVSVKPVRAAPASVRVVGLQVDNLSTPLGLENVRPRLSWRLESSERNVKQRAYRVLVASSEALLRAGRGDLWNSGKVSSRRSIGIRYAGRALASRQRCWWSVRVWGARGGFSASSDPCVWEMGLLGASDWEAQWLAVEDATSKADREAGLQWVWDKAPEAVHPPGIRRFRGSFHLPDGAAAGQLLVTRHGAAQIRGLWVDGVALPDPTGTAGEMFPRVQWRPLERLSAGTHVIALEVDVPAPTPSQSEAVPNYGITAFARFTLPDGRILRVGRELQWVTGGQSDERWQSVAFDDRTWSAAQRADLSGYEPWPAQCAMQFRKTFNVRNAAIIAARLYATALGAYEARLNGKRIGDYLLTPEPSQYAKHVLYQVYDVTGLLHSGENVIGMTVGDGWYASFNSFTGRYVWAPSPRRVLAQLELTYADGAREVIATDPSWRTAESPIRMSEIRRGEIYDARLEHNGWDVPGFDDRAWVNAELAETPSCRVVSQTSPPIRATQTSKPLTLTQPRPGVYVFDFGRCFAGWCRLQVRGTAGAEVELRFAELLTSTGEVDQYWLSIGEPKRDVFILRGTGTERFEPHFTYRGFRYVQLTGTVDPPTLDSIEGVVIHSDLGMTGQVRSGAALLEQIWSNTVRSQRSNFVGIPTDCSSREQLGYLGDAGAFWDAAAFNMDVAAFTRRQMRNAVDDQESSGSFPLLTPLPRYNSGAVFPAGGTPPGWGEGAIILPWTAWMRYADTAVIEENWEAMNRHLQFIESHNPEYLWRNKRGVDHGDWLAIDQTRIPNDAKSTPRELLATAYWAHAADLLAQMGHAIERTADAERLHRLFERIAHAFTRAYTRDDGRVGDGSQTCQSLALRFGLLPQELRQAAAKYLADDVRRRGVSLTTGILGTPFILDALADAGYADLAYGLLLRTDYPSWGHMIHQGATTIWELWRGEIEYDGRIQKMSQNHYALGAVCGFLFRRMAGIDVGQAGFQEIRIRPLPDIRLKRGGGDYDSVMGRISTNWTVQSDGHFTLDVAIPANTDAQVYLPATRAQHLSEGGRDVTGRKDVRVIARLDREILLQVGSGSYQFVVHS